MVTIIETNIKDRVKSKIFVKGFNTDFEVTLYRKSAMTIEQAQFWAQKRIVETAIVKAVKNYYSDGTKHYIKNS